MKQLRDKIKKVAPLIMAKEANFQREMTTLNQISDLKMDALNYLRLNQQKYMKGVDQVNQERSNGNFDGAAVLEPAIEFVKRKWHESLREVQRLEKEQEQQTQIVLNAQTELKSMQALEEKYKDELAEYLKVQDQKLMDEIGQNMKNRES